MKTRATATTNSQDKLAAALLAAFLHAIGVRMESVDEVVIKRRDGLDVVFRPGVD